jgi:hypothetical protein
MLVTDYTLRRATLPRSAIRDPRSVRITGAFFLPLSSGYSVDRNVPISIMTDIRQIVIRDLRTTRTLNIPIHSILELLSNQREETVKSHYAEIYW